MAFDINSAKPVGGGKFDMSTAKPIGQANMPVGKAESFARGASQGASLGFADEGEGVIKTALDYLMQKHGDKPLSEIYQLERDAARQKYAAADSANPITYKTGEAAGAAATMLVPGAGEANAAKLAGMGAAYGLGGSTADLTRGQVVNASKDALKGADVMMGAGLAGQAAVAAAKYVPGIAKRAVSNVFGPSAEAVEARLQNPSAIQNASNHAEIAGKVPETLKKIQRNISDADSEAWKTLSKSQDPKDGAIPSNTIMDLLDGVKKQIGNPVGRADKEAIKTITGIKDDLREIYPQSFIEYPKNTEIYTESQIPNQPSQRLIESHISESDLKGIIQKIDANTNWDKPGAETTNIALKALRNKLDTMLKTQNPQYKEAMVPVQEHVDLLNDAEKLFVPKKVAGQGYLATDTTISKLSNLKREGKDASKSILAKIKETTGDDYLTATQNADIAKQFVGGKANGSRNVVRGAATGGGLGSAIGGSVGGWPGAAIGGNLGGVLGANVGATIDKEGGKMAANILDWYSSHPDQINVLAKVFNTVATKAPQVAGRVSTLNNKEQTWQDRLLNK